LILFVRKVYFLALLLFLRWQVVASMWAGAPPFLGPGTSSFFFFFRRLADCLLTIPTDNPKRFKSFGFLPLFPFSPGVDLLRRFLIVFRIAGLQLLVERFFFFFPPLPPQKQPAPPFFFLFVKGKGSEACVLGAASAAQGFFPGGNRVYFSSSA